MNKRSRAKEKQNGISRGDGVQDVSVSWEHSVLREVQRVKLTKNSLRARKGFLGGSAVKNPPAHAGNMGSVPGLGKSPGEGNGYPLQYSCLEISWTRGAWWATVTAVANSWTRLSDQTATTLTRKHTPRGMVQRAWAVCICGNPNP